MLKSWIAFAAAGLLLTACANDRHAAKTALGGGPGAAMTGCADQGCGNSDPGHHQYYDEHAKRFYYYDGAAGRYNWEDGTPRN